MSDKTQLMLLDGNIISVESGIPLLSEEQSSEAWFKEPSYDVDTIEIDTKSMECFVHYSTEKFFGEKKDKGAPAAGKMKITWFGLGSKVVFNDGSTVANNMQSIFSSPYVKRKIKEFNDYYIKEKGYRPFTQKDKETFKIDAAQLIRKIYNFSLMQSLQIQWFEGTAIYGLFSQLLGKGIDNLIKKQREGGASKLIPSVVASQAVADMTGKIAGKISGTIANAAVNMAGLSQSIVANLAAHHIAANIVALPISHLFKNSLNSGPSQAPFCIAYVKENENGEKRVFIKRFLIVGIWTIALAKGHSKWASGGKEIGTVK
jgi:hypothetical protein